MTNKDEIEAALIARYATEDEQAAADAKLVDPLLGELTPGQHYFGKVEFEAMARLLLTETERIELALIDGSFTVGGRVTVLRVPEMLNRMVTASALARTTGLPQRSLTRLLANSRLPHVKRGREKLYNIDHVRNLLAKQSPENGNQSPKRKQIRRKTG